GRTREGCRRAGEGLRRTDHDAGAGREGQAARAQLDGGPPRPAFGVAGAAAMRTARLVLVLVCLLLSSAGAALAGDYEDGLAAYNRNDYKTAAKLWRPLAEKGNAVAQYNLGAMYFNGQGVVKNFTEAEKWWRAAAEHGNPDAQLGLGYMYYSGHGARQNYVTA